MTMPYDGRSRPTPDYDSNAMPPEEFQEAFCEELVRTILEIGVSPKMPDDITVDEARLYHGTYLRYMSFFAWKFPSWLMSVASLCPYQDVRKEIINDCIDEEVGDPDADDRQHIELLYDEAEQCGVTRETIYATKPTPPITAAIHAWENLTRTLGWLPGFAAISGLEISQSEPALKVRERLAGPGANAHLAQHLGGQTFHEKLGFPEGTLQFFSLHSYKDQFHGGGELALLVKYANTKQLQDESLWAVRTSLEIMSVHAWEVRRLAAAAIGRELVRPPLPVG